MSFSEAITRYEKQHKNMKINISNNFPAWFLVKHPAQRNIRLACMCTDLYRVLIFSALFSYLFHTEKKSGKFQNPVKIVHMQVVLFFPHLFSYQCSKKEEFFFPYQLLQKRQQITFFLPATIIMQMEKIFSLSVSAAMLPKPTEVMQVIV